MSNGGRCHYDGQEMATIGNQIQKIPLLTVSFTNGLTGFITPHAFLSFAGYMSTTITMDAQRRKTMGRNPVITVVECVVPSLVE